MSEEVKSEGKDSLSEVVSTPKPTKETYLKARVDYESGSFRDLKELSSKYGLDYDYLRQKIHKEKWKSFKLTVNNKVSQIVEQKVESKVERLFSKLEKKAEKYERMVELSQESYGSKHSDGTPLLDADVIETYAKTESRIIEWNKLALGITDKVQVSGEVNINVVSILAKIRESRKPGYVIDEEKEKFELSTCKLIEG